MLATFAYIYYRNEGDIQWTLAASQTGILNFYSVAVTGASLSLEGVVHSGATRYIGNLTGSFLLAPSVEASARVSIDTSIGLASMHAEAKFTSQYVDVAVALDYEADPICNTPPALSDSLSSYNVASFVGQVRSTQITVVFILRILFS